MALFPSLPDRPLLGDVFKRFPDGIGALLEYHDVLLRGPSPLSVGEREMLAAYISALNACGFCHGVHRTIAEIHGIDAGVLERIVVDPATAGVDPKLLPLFAYVRKLNETPSRMVDADAAAVYAAGWNEQALFHAVSVCALYNFMNRLVQGCGVVTDDRVIQNQRAQHEALRDDPASYRKFGRRLGILP